MRHCSSLFLSASFDCNNVHEIPPAECQALVALFHSTNGHGWTYNNWLVGNTPCRWLGVSCTGGRVTTLELLFTELAGSIPAEVGNLTRLQTLYLMGNQLRGPIPSQLGSLSNLRALSLSSNQLSGAILPELGHLAQLEELNLSGNQLTGPIPAELGRLAKLYELNLSDDQLRGPVPEALGDLSGLVWLVLSNNALSGPLPQSLTRLSVGVFSFENTGLCEPADDAFQTWLAGIEELQGSGIHCDASK